MKAAEGGVQAYAAGLTFALAASPCSTPVLATLLAYVSTTQKPVEGAGLLLAYTTGSGSHFVCATVKYFCAILCIGWYGTA